jgi:phosphatidylinositol alpha-1,6-mannosyltransferase
MKASLCIAAQYASPGFGGIARVVHLVARVAAAEKVPATLLVAAEKRPVDDFGIPVRCFGGSRAGFLLAAQVAGLTASHFLYDFAGSGRAHLFSRLLGRPYAVWIHGTEVWEGARSNYLRVMRGAHTMFVSSGFTRDTADRLHGGFERAKVCWLATLEDEPAEIIPPSGPPSVLILANMAQHYKGQDLLIDAWPHVVHEIPDARLLIAGRWLGAEIEVAARRSPAAANIDILGFIPEEKLVGLWHRTTVYAMPSMGEGFGLVYIEAMRYRRPVIASTQDAGCEVNRHGITGFNIDRNQRSELVQALVALLADPALARRMGNAGRDLWACEFRYSRFRARFAPMLHEFLSAH